MKSQGPFPGKNKKINHIDMFQASFYSNFLNYNNISLKFVSMMLRIILLACLLATLQADTSVTMDCKKCLGGICAVFTGDGFTGKQLPLPGKTSCKQISSAFPVTYNIQCSSQCDQGCMIITNDPEFPSNACTSSLQGNVLLASLNLMYSLEKNDVSMSQKYPWCQCQSGASGAFWIIFILLILIGGGAAAFYFLYWKKLKQRQANREELSATMGHYQLH